ncbi:sulfate adenylyltransferase subunit CysN [Chromatiaceae bacterium AAb-1]|nr:sulfate adenylyltransferase subunit CysN [Chromatiaceae bacterium AAb-1]
MSAILSTATPLQQQLDSLGIRGYLQQHQDKGLLRVLTCGSVDDGKSTLIGRLLHDSQQLYDDQLEALKRDHKGRNNEGELELAMLVDGLQAEREQGITIDVAYRYFSTSLRKFILADTPGHEQYTRNMATGASTADVAILLIDARYGVQTQTRRHSFICALLGIKHFIVAVNKMDIIGYEQARFEQIKHDIQALTTQLQVPVVDVVPLSALKGENILTPSAQMPWYQGASLLPLLETLPIPQRSGSATRFPVQYVIRPDLNFRGFAGTLVSGRLAVGQQVTVYPSGKKSTIKQLVTFDGELTEAIAGQAVTVTLHDEIDISRGDWLVPSAEQVSVSNRLQAHLIWFDEQPLQPGRLYDLKLATRKTSVSIRAPEHKINVNTLEQEAASALQMNDIALAELELTETLPLDTFTAQPGTGNFILIDRLTNATVAAGLIHNVPGKNSNIQWQPHSVTSAERQKQLGHQSAVVWFTGLSGSGKSTVADALEQALTAAGVHTYLLDGDNVRHGLCADLGFSAEDRTENLRRVGAVAGLMADAGLVVLSAFISPYRSQREMVRQFIPAGKFIEIHIATPLEVCEQRDIKGLYQKARNGEISQFTGISDPYEAPQSPDLVLDTSVTPLEHSVQQLLDLLKVRGIIG